MGRCLLLTIVIAAGLFPSRGEAASTVVQVTQLRCEYMTNPLGIDAARPRLSWVIESERRGERQTAYQVLVAGSPGELEKDRGDLWDSGKVESSQSVHVNYAGKPLVSGKRAWWKVRVWAQDGRASAFSEPAWWEMGLLAPEDWGARWISAAPPRDTAGLGDLLGDAKWIWTDEGDPSVVAPDGERFFRMTFNLRGRPRGGVRIAVTADDEYVVYVNGQRVGRGNWPEVGEFSIAPRLLLPQAENVIAIRAVNHGGTAGLIAAYLGGPGGAKQIAAHTLLTDRHWKASKQAAQGWNQPGFDDSKWTPVKELGKFGSRPWGRLAQPSKVAPAPHFRKVFTLRDKVRSARAYVSGLGYYELYINGAKVGDHVLDPGFTRYDKRVLYATYDVTGQLHSGENAVGAVLGNGWYNFHPKAVWSFDKAPWRDAPCLIARLDITYQDGSRATIVSDQSWTTADGPILFDGLMMGEVYDARREMPGWSTADFAAAGWKPAQVITGPAGRLSAQAMPAIKVVRQITPVKLTQPKPGVWVFDMGQAFAGWAELRVSGPAGSKVVLRYGERLTPDGMVEQQQIGEHFRQGGFQTDTYILNGHGVETWAPRFNYHGFRWVEVTTPDSNAVQFTPESLRGQVVSTAFEPAGKFECSNPLLNKIMDCTRWSYEANFHSYPTDCPHREKNGWTGDAHLAAEQAMYTCNNVPAYEKWMRDLKDEQRPSGELPGIVPTSGWGYHWGNGPAWDSAYVLIPWYLYEYYGDRGVLREHYEGMKRYVDYLTGRSKDGIVDFGLGDWVPLKERTPVALTSTGYYYIDTVIVSKAARLLDKPEDAATYAALAERIRAAFNSRFLDKASGQYAGGTQTAQSCALHQGLVTDEQRQAALAALVANVQRHDGHLDCGILGAKYLLRALSDNGHSDLAYTVASQKTYPGWGYWISELGATTLWEDWKGESSRIHIMLGDVAAWMYRAIGGIQPDPERPGFEHIIIRPEPVGDLTSARAEYNSIRGKILSSWRKEGGIFKLDLRIPANSTATLYLPVDTSEKVTESGAAIGEAAGIQFQRCEAGRCVYTLLAGSYHF